VLAGVCWPGTDSPRITMFCREVVIFRTPALGRVWPERVLLCRAFKREGASVDQQPFAVSEHDEQGSLRLAVTGEIDVATAPTLRERLDGAIDRGTGILIVDLLGVTFLDSTALGVLIGARERCQQQSMQLRIVLSEARIVKIFEITGLTEMFSIFPTLAQAVA
jgi:anti-sigma B factor antagonist